MESTTKRSSAESAAEPLGPDGRAGPIPLPAGGDAVAGRIELRAVGAERLERVRTTTAHCTIVTVDIEGFGRYSRNNTNMVRVRHGLYLAMRHAFDTAGIVWESCRREDRGDGILVLAPADIPKTLFADHLPDTLLDALAGHNRIHPGEEQIRLRLAIHAGEINYDEHGVTGASIVHAFRILDSAELKQALEETAAVLAFAGSGWFFDEVIRHSERSRAQDYRATDITNKETTTRAWIRLLPA
ncbi:hypothetical protein [Amycolatopsis samaneae]|uniref:Guanylate cyclase domain-containing protein n=1 Tax=Amycolatopsis samaneae TaxID=664691 RepID=A0ABW5GMK2_9PSEU